MNYNFDEEINRRNTNCVKWDARADVPEDTIPMWVADMDFKAAPAILEALSRRVEAGVFGYTHVPDSYYQAIDQWFSRWHGWHISKEQVIYTSGVVPAISAILKALTRPGDGVLIMAPVYNCFYSCIRNNGCKLMESNLMLQGRSYQIDWADLEAKASQDDCRVLLLCNPHNPAGRVWTADELRRVGEICKRHGVTVVSDEIHCELVYRGHAYTPYANIAPDRWIACISPSKAFNIAGLQIANIVVSDAELYAKIDRAINDNEVCDVNPFGVEALLAAYNHSREWLEALLEYIYGNYQLLEREFAARAAQLTVLELEGTYLAWVDCRSITTDTEALEEELIQRARVWVNAGVMYGSAGQGFIRINLACPRHRVKEAIDRMLPILEEKIRNNNNKK